MEMDVKTIWSKSWLKNKRAAKGFTIRLTRDLSKIDVNLEFGNMPMRKTDAKRGMRLAMRHFAPAAESLMEARRNLTIHSVSAALIAASRNEDGSVGWNRVEEHLHYPIIRRAASTVTPQGWEAKTDNDKLQWRLPGNDNEVMRLPGKRILIPDFQLSDGVIMDNDRILLPKRLPASILVAKMGQPLQDLITIPGFEDVNIRITDAYNWGKGTGLSIKSPTIDMEDAFKLMGGVIDRKRTAGAEPRSQPTTTS